MNLRCLKLFTWYVALIVHAKEISVQSAACEHREWACESEDCIDLNKVCDGLKDCIDGSDETIESCGKTVCSRNLYRCDYGGCVDSAAKCDGLQDCIDNSDEKLETCANGNNVRPQIPTTQNKNDASTLGSTQTSALIILFNKNGVLNTKPASTSKKRCKLDILPNVIAKHKHRPGELESGQFVAHAASVVYKCRALYSLEGAKGNLCVNGQWYNDHPKCNKLCSSIFIIGATIETKCDVEGSEISCYEPLPGTTARISCKKGYQKPVEEFPEVLSCGEDGQWDHRPVPCVQICGRVEDGNSSNYLAPWHAGIYMQYQFNQFCGGTIINARVVLSAALCYWDIKNNELMDKSLFEVAVGKQRSYHHVYEEESPQFFNLVEIYITPNFKDGAWFNNNDLAILVLDKYINFEPFIKPICIDWELNSKEPLVPNLPGRIAGWDRKDDFSHLETEDMTIVRSEECASVLDSIYSNPYTGDKFCARRNKERCVLQRGGGFVVRSQNVFYLRGILSHSVNFKPVCSETPYIAITDIQFFSEIITEYDVRFRPRF